MNGGVHHSVECLVAERELANAVQGYVFLGLASVGELLQSAATGPLSPWTDETEQVANELYSRLVPDDAFLVKAFRAVLRARPDDFAPLAG